MKKVLQFRDVGMDQIYEDLEPGEEKDKLDGDYTAMANVLGKMEVNIYRILGVETGWFSRQTYQVKKWILENPKKAATIVGVSAALLAGVLGTLSENGVHLLCALGVAPTMGVAANIAVGATVGLLAGSLVLFICDYALSRREYQKVTDEAALHAAEIKRMVEELSRI